MYGKDAKQLEQHHGVRIAPSKSSWPGYLSTIKAAKANGAIVFASPWTLHPNSKIEQQPPARLRLGTVLSGLCPYLNDYTCI